MFLMVLSMLVVNSRTPRPTILPSTNKMWRSHKHV